MEGFLYQRGKAKTWYLRYDVPTAPGEKRRQKNMRIGAMSKADAEVHKRKILRRIDEGTMVEDRASLTVEKFLSSWLDASRERLATTTHVRYADLVKRHVLPVVGQLRLSKVAPEHVRSVYVAAREKGLSNQTCLHVHRVLHTAFAYAVREERILKENVVSRVKAPRPDQRELQTMSRDKVKLLIVAARGTRLELPVALGALTGLRRGELLALRWRNVDLQKASFFVVESLEQTRRHGVRFKAPKSRSSRRFVPLSPDCVELLSLHKGQQDALRAQAGRAYAENDLVFCNSDGSPWPPDTFSVQFGKLAASVGLKGFRFHDMRHAFASITLADGVSIKEVQTLMGHSSPTVTLSVYARSMEGLGRQAVNNLARSLLAS